MIASSKDPLLTAARTTIIVTRILLVAAMAAMAGAGIVLVAAPTAFHIPTVATTSANEVIAGVLALLVLAIAGLGLSYDFVGRLAGIVHTVREGNPFTPVNAARLTRMGWLALAIQILVLPITLLGSWMEPLVDRNHFTFDSKISFSGIILALVLFVLARVFRQGSAMREELEGTV